MIIFNHSNKVQCPSPRGPGIARIAGVARIGRITITITIILLVRIARIAGGAHWYGAQRPYSVVHYYRLPYYTILHLAPCYGARRRRYG